MLSLTAFVLAEFDADDDVALDTDSWPMYGYDNGNYNPHANAQTTEMSVAWSKGENAGTPIVADGNLYFMRGDPDMCCMALQSLDASDGSERWSREVGIGEGGWEDQINIAVADGKVYLSHLGETLVYDADDGTRLQTFESGGEKPRVTDELLVVGGWEFQAISREDGSVRWSWEDLDQVDAYAISGDSVYVSHYEEGYDEPTAFLYSLSLANGSTKWSAELDRYRNVATQNSDVFATEDYVYASSDTRVQVFDAGTGERGKTVISASVNRPAVNDGTMYVFVGDCLNAVSQEKAVADWSVEAEEHVSNQPVVAGDALYYSTWKEDGEKEARDQIVVRDVETGELIARHDVPCEKELGTGVIHPSSP